MHRLINVVSNFKIDTLVLQDADALIDNFGCPQKGRLVWQKIGKIQVSDIKKKIEQTEA